MRRLAIALLAAVSACSDLSSPNARLAQLETARRKWQATGLHDYTFTFQRSCFCGLTDPLEVFVVRDTVSAAFDTRTQQAVDRSAALTVDSLFAFVERAARDKPAVLEVDYDPTAGYPTRISYDGSRMVADDELTYRASGLRPAAVALDVAGR